MFSNTTSKVTRLDVASPCISNNDGQLIKLTRLSFKESIVDNSATSIELRYCFTWYFCSKIATCADENGTLGFLPSFLEVGCMWVPDSPGECLLLGGLCFKSDGLGDFPKISLGDRSSFGDCCDVCTFKHMSAEDDLLYPKKKTSFQ